MSVLVSAGPLPPPTALAVLSSVEVFTQLSSGPALVRRG